MNYLGGTQLSFVKDSCAPELKIYQWFYFEIRIKSICLNKGNKNIIINNNDDKGTVIECFLCVRLCALYTLTYYLLEPIIIILR